MFGLKKSGIVKLKVALDEVQSYLYDKDESLTLEDYQKPIVPETQTFKKYGAMIEKGHASPFGALTNYCNNAISVVMKGISENRINVPIVIHIGEKMAHVALAIRDCVLIETLSEAELVLLEDTEKLARDWLSLEARKRVINDVNIRVEIVKNKLKDKGVIELVKNQQQFLQPLMTWA